MGPTPRAGQVAIQNDSVVSAIGIRQQRFIKVLEELRRSIARTTERKIRTIRRFITLHDSLRACPDSTQVAR